MWVDVPTVFDLVQRMSWNWFINNTAKAPFLLYEWVWNPGNCMLREGLVICGSGSLFLDCCSVFAALLFVLLLLFFVC
jgi:hypothetical protein